MSVVSADIEPLTFVFEDDGLVPNNPMPFLVYKGAIDVANDHPEKTIEGLFGANGWGEMWRNGVYDYLHYHATVHEALGVARGHARVRFGGDRGKEFEISAGDVAILPAGTGHQCLSASRDFCVVGAYPPGSEDAGHAADAGKSSQSAEDDSGSEAAEDRSGAGRGRAAGEVVESQGGVRKPRRIGKANEQRHGTAGGRGVSHGAGSGEDRGGPDSDGRRRATLPKGSAHHH